MIIFDSYGLYWSFWQQDGLVVPVLILKSYSNISRQSPSLKNNLNTLWWNLWLYHVFVSQGPVVDVVNTSSQAWLMDYIMICLGRFNRLTVWHFLVIDYGFAHITFRDSIRDWVHGTWFDLWFIDCDSGSGTEGLRSGLRDSGIGSTIMYVVIMDISVQKFIIWSWPITLKTPVENV